MLEIKEALNGGARPELRAGVQVRSNRDQGWLRTELGSRKSLLADEQRLPGKPDVSKLARHQLSKSTYVFSVDFLV